MKICHTVSSSYDFSFHALHKNETVGFDVPQGEWYDYLSKKKAFEEAHEKLKALATKGTYANKRRTKNIQRRFDYARKVFSRIKEREEAKKEPVVLKEPEVVKRTEAPKRKETPSAQGTYATED